MAGLFDTINNQFNNTPALPATVPLDPKSQGLLTGMTDRANQTPAQNTGLLNANVSSVAQQLGQTPNQMNKSQAQTGVDPGTMGAIRNNYYRQASVGIDQVKNQNRLQGEMMKANQLQGAMQAMLHQQQVQLNQYQVLNNAYNQSEMTRVATINSLFQAGNQGMGMYAAGHPRVTMANNPFANQPESYRGDFSNSQGSPGFDNPGLETPRMPASEAY